MNSIWSDHYGAMQQFLLNLENCQLLWEEHLVGSSQKFEEFSRHRRLARDECPVESAWGGLAASEMYPAEVLDKNLRWLKSGQKLDDETTITPKKS